jgi:hypothetical protein
METKFGVKGTVCGGIFFTEQPIPASVLVRHIHVEISRQNSNLGEVKEKLAGEAMSLGATAIANFRYGQKPHKRWELVFTLKWDTESWHGEGDAVKI